MNQTIVGWDKAGFAAAGPPSFDRHTKKVGRRSLCSLVPPYGKPGHVDE
jgi:hypothetical protein